MTDVKQLLPIGSVIRLRGAKRDLMIFGIRQTKKNSQKEYDYVGVLWPEGNMGAETQVLFAHEDIENVVFTGYDTLDRQQFIERLSAFYESRE